MKELNDWDISKIRQTYSNRIENYIIDNNDEGREIYKNALRSFEFIMKHSDLFATGEFRKINFPEIMQPVFEKHFEIIRNKKYNFKIIEVGFRFDGWVIYTSCAGGAPLYDILILIDELCNELNAVEYLFLQN